MPEQQTRLLAERYELIAPLGRGTMGTVWRARDRALGREVAVKEIRQDPGLTEEQRAELRERMVREGRLASRINHPSIAAIHDVLVHENSPWIIMELIEARSLEQVIEEEGPLPPRLVAEIGVDLLGALRAAHAQGITHRDVKPGNVLITESGRVVLTDFGIAKAEGDPRLTKTGMVIGSPGYTAPERARGEYTGPESDVWSLGATLYYAVEGRPAYERATIAETLAALLSENADPPTQAGQLRPVLNGLLHKDYRQRLSSAKAQTLLRIIADTPTHEMPVITAEALVAQEAGVPDPNDTAPAAQPRREPAQRPAQAPPRGAQPPPRAPRAASPQGPPPGQYGAPQQHYGGPPQGRRPQQQQPGPAPHHQAPPREPEYDPNQTVSMMRPKTPLPGGPPQGGPDDSSATTRIHQPPSNFPGQQVYPLPNPPMQQPGPQNMAPPPMRGGPQQQPGPYPGDERSDGLGTDLFAVYREPEQRPAGNRSGMLVLMAVAAAAAVVIAVLIVALLSS